MSNQEVRANHLNIYIDLPKHNKEFLKSRGITQFKKTAICL